MVTERQIRAIKFCEALGSPKFGINYAYDEINKYLGEHLEFNKKLYKQIEQHVLQFYLDNYKDG